jgi:hypothetical protein
MAAIIVCFWIMGDLRDLLSLVVLVASLFLMFPQWPLASRKQKEGKTK